MEAEGWRFVLAKLKENLKRFIKESLCMCMCVCVFWTVPALKTQKNDFSILSLTVTAENQTEPNKRIQMGKKTHDLK